MKIGYTTNLKKRIQQYTLHNPNFKLLCISEGTKFDENYFRCFYEQFLDSEWGYYKQEAVDNFLKFAYLKDFYFETDYKTLAFDDPIGNIIKTLSEEELKQYIQKHKKSLIRSTSTKLENNKIIWNPNRISSYNIYIHELMLSLPNIPKKESEILLDPEF